MQPGQDIHLSFRANERLVSALHKKATDAGCSVSEYLRAVVRDRVGLQ